MQTATIDVTFVKQPSEGKQYGSIKSADNVWWPVKMERIREFEPGNKYELAYTESDKGFKNIIGVKKITAAQPEPRGDFKEFREPAQSKPQPQQYWQPKPTAPKDGKRMCITSLMNAGITSHQIPFTKEALTAAFRAVSEAYDEAIASED